MYWKSDLSKIQNWIFKSLDEKASVTNTIVPKLYLVTLGHRSELMDLM